MEGAYFCWSVMICDMSNSSEIQFGWNPWVVLTMICCNASVPYVLSTCHVITCVHHVVNVLCVINVYHVFVFIMCLTRSQTQMWVWGENNEKLRSWGMISGSQHFGGRGACWSFRMGLGRMIRNHSLTWACAKPNNKLVSA
jgi:hypothetical protein